jgi:MscS family membrane protein
MEILTIKRMKRYMFVRINFFMDRPFKTGDYIVLDSGERGQVVEVGLHSTRILTRDDIQIQKIRTDIRYSIAGW